MAACPAASRPTSTPASSSSTFATALSTLRPPNADGSPSRSSSASCAPVLAPDGTSRPAPPRPRREPHLRPRRWAAHGSRGSGGRARVRSVTSALRGFGSGAAAESHPRGSHRGPRVRCTRNERSAPVQPLPRRPPGGRLPLPRGDGGPGRGRRLASRRPSSRRCARTRGLRDAGNLRGWVLTIARRTAIDAARGRRRRPQPARRPGAARRKRHAGPRGSGALGGGPRAAAPPARGRDPALRQRPVLRGRGRVIGSSEDAARRSAFEGLRRLREVWDER